MKEQLELSLNTNRHAPPSVRRQRSVSRARWWFEQMHVVVDRAFDWSASPAPRPEQVNLTLARGR